MIFSGLYLQEEASLKKRETVDLLRKSWGSGHRKQEQRRLSSRHEEWGVSLKVEALRDNTGGGEEFFCVIWLLPARL